MRRIREVLRLRHEAGRSQREIARACGMGSGTVSEYLGRARQAGLSWPLPEELDDAALEAQLFPTLEPGHQRIPPDLGWIYEELKRPGVTLYLLWEEYRGAHSRAATATASSVTTTPAA